MDCVKKNVLLAKEADYCGLEQIKIFYESQDISIAKGTFTS